MPQIIPSNIVRYPAVSVFPRNPDFASWIKPRRVVEKFIPTADTVQARSGQITSTRTNSLDFAIGVGGKQNIIRTSSAPYIDYMKYDYKNNVWSEEPIILTIVGNSDVENLTDYTKKVTVGFSGEASGINDKIQYFFDGEKIVTNMDFANPNDREKITVTYTKLIDSVRVKATLVNTCAELGTATPTVDQYTLMVGKQHLMD